MFIIIHCGGMPFNGDTIKQKSLGGSETAAYYMAKELASLGHAVTVFTNSPDEGRFDGVKYTWAGEITQETPLGNRFQFYAANTPHDVSIIQRMPHAFAYPIDAKLKFLWMHDLALYRSKDVAQHGLENVDGILCVSEYHKKQLCDVYGYNPEYVHAITNGVDLVLFDKPRFDPGSGPRLNLFYSSRPERGLIHLLREGGIMDRLPDCHLYYCAYENKTPEMAGLYDFLDQRATQMPNVTNLGALTKQGLADAMLGCDVHVYPTEFEEVSCITAMETMAAGLPLITSDVGALRETCKVNVDAGVVLIPLKDGEADEDKFVQWLTDDHIFENLADMSAVQISNADYYSWRNAAIRVMGVVDSKFVQRTANYERLAEHLIHNSDYYAYRHLEKYHPVLADMPIGKEVEECYDFAKTGKFKEHYESYYEYEARRGVNYGPESLDGNMRFEHVSSLVANLPEGAWVLDYGCAHGHYTVNLAKRFPKLSFVGIDLAQSNVDKARKWAEDEKLTNVVFWQGDATSTNLTQLGEKFDFIIAAEVLEHVAKPQALADTLSKHLTNNGVMCITVPYGPWEAQGYKEHWPWRAHIHHFEREDLSDAFGHHPGYNVTAAPTGSGYGSYIVTYGKPSHTSRGIDYDRKLRQQAPAQTISACIIAKDCANTIGKCLESLVGVVDEVVVGVDRSTTDKTTEVLEDYFDKFPRGVNFFFIDSPLEIGFAAARNLTIEQARGDWILWIDSDEVLFDGHELKRYARWNQFDGYALAQIHYSAKPAIVLRTDYPCRMFRNNKGIKFWGFVHEHPETAINEGIGKAAFIHSAVIGHYGYSTEEVRRKRFMRNIGLLIKDRKENPHRKLGMYLWLRDLAQMCQYEAETTGGQITQAMQQRAQLGINVFEEMLEKCDSRMILDAVEFYTTCVRVMGIGFDFSLKANASKTPNGAPVSHGQEIAGTFHNKTTLDKVINMITKEKVQDYESKYY